MNFFGMVYSFLEQRYAHRPAVHITSHGLSAFRRYVNGQITLQEFRDADCRIEVKKVQNEPTGIR